METRAANEFIMKPEQLVSVPRNLSLSRQCMYDTKQRRVWDCQLKGFINNNKEINE